MLRHPHTLATARRAATLAAVALLVLALAAPAFARTRTVVRHYVGVRHGAAVVFHLHRLRPARVRWARLYVAGHSVRISTGRLERAARTGTFRVRSRAHRAGLAIGLVINSRSASTARIATSPRSAGSGAPAPVSAALAGIPATAIYVSPRGADDNAGTPTAPWRTLAHAVTAARPGATVVIEPGTYGAPGKRTDWTATGTADAPITFIGDPAATSRPRILGYNVLHGSHVRVENLFFDGPTGRVDAPTASNPDGQEVMIWADAPDVAIVGCEIARSLWHAGIYLSNASRDQLIGNYIHDNGNFSDPAQANEDQGIYWGDGDGGVIADNLIVHNYAFGVQLYPNARNVAVEYNTIVANHKSGVVVDAAASDNTIHNNVVAGNGQYSIRSGSSLSGRGNVVRDNLVWGNAQGDFGATTGLSLQGNLQQTGRFVGQGDFELAPSSPGFGGEGIYTNPAR